MEGVEGVGMEEAEPLQDVRLKDPNQIPWTLAVPWSHFLSISVNANSVLSVKSQLLDGSRIASPSPIFAVETLSCCPLATFTLMSLTLR